MSVQLVEAGPAGHRYKLVAPGDDESSVRACLWHYQIIPTYEGVFVITPPEGSAERPFGAHSPLMDPGVGVAVQMPDLPHAGITDPPLDMLCPPRAEFPITAAVLFTNSLAEARGMLSTPSSFILREPAAGWIETGKPVAASSISWGRLALAGAGLAAAGYLVFR